MIAVDYNAVINDWQGYCRQVLQKDDTMIVTGQLDSDMVIMSLERYNEMEREIKNAAYLKKLKRSFAQLRAGEGVEHELIRDEV